MTRLFVTFVVKKPNSKGYSLRGLFLKIGYLFVGLLAFSKAYGQIDTRINLQDFDDRKIHYGYSMALNYSTFKLGFSDDFTNQDTISQIQPIGGPGFELGFILNYRLGEFFDVRALPKVAFYERTLRYHFKGTDTFEDAVFEASALELPLVIKYKSFRRKNSRLYMVGGVKTAFEVGAKKRQKRNDQIGLKTVSVSAEYGIGWDMYYPLFKFAPELKFSLGLTDLFITDDNIYSTPLANVKPYNITLAILFE